MSDQAVVKQEEFALSKGDLGQDVLLELINSAVPKPIEQPENLELESFLKPEELSLKSAEVTEHQNFEPIVPKPIELPSSLKLEPNGNHIEVSKPSNVELTIPRPIELLKNLKLEPCVEKPIEFSGNLKLELFTKQLEDLNYPEFPVVPKPNELSSNLKLELSPNPVEVPKYPESPSVPKPIELPKNLKLESFDKSTEISKYPRIEPGVPKPIALPKGFKIEPIPKHLEIPIPKPFQIEPVARNVEVPMQAEATSRNLEPPVQRPIQKYLGKPLSKPFYPPKQQRSNPKMVLETDHSKYTFPMQMTNPYERENWTVSTDHCYARPWNWRPETTFLKPAKTLFIQKGYLPDRLFSKAVSPKNVEEEEIDVDGEPKATTPLYDVDSAKKMMDECNRQAALMRGSVDENWEEKINKSSWSPPQHRLYNGMVTILNNYHLAKLCQSGVTSEPILRRTAIDKAVTRTRRLFATVSLDIKVLQWLHNILLDNLDQSYLGDYLDILQTLKAKLPNFVDKIIHGSQRIGPLSIENISNILKKPWDPVASSLNQDKPKKLPGGPIIILVPSGPIHTKRAHKWMLLLANLGNVVSVPTNFTGTGTRLTMTSCLDQLFALTRGRVQEMRDTYPGKHIILVGFGAGATLAVQVAHVENVFCVVSLGFSLLTAEGRRGEPDDNLLELQCPVLFAIGQSSSTCLQEDLDDLRSRMRVETGLIVVGSADNNLVVNKKKRREEGITQSIVDRCIIDEVGEFISGLILSPFPPQIRTSPAPVPEIVSKKTPKSNERKRYNSTMSDESEPPSPTPAPPIPRLSRIGRPSGAARIKSKLEAKWAAQIAQGTSSAPSSTQNSSYHRPITPLSPPSSNDTTIINVEDESSDTASASESRSVTPSPQRLRTSKSPIAAPKGIVLATRTNKGDGGLVKQLLSPATTRKIKMLKPLASTTGKALSSSTKALSPSTKALLSTTKTVVSSSASPGESRTVKITISQKPKEPARIQAYNLNRNLPLKGQLSTLLQGGIKTIPPVQNKPPSTIKGRTIDLSKLTTVSASNNVMLLPDGKIKTIQAVGTVGPTTTGARGMAGPPRSGPNKVPMMPPISSSSSDSNPVPYINSGHHNHHNPVPYGSVPSSVPYYSGRNMNSHPYAHPFSVSPHDRPYGASHGTPHHNVPHNNPHGGAPCNVQNMAPVPHPPPRYGRPLFPLPPMSFLGGMHSMRNSMPLMMRRPKFVPSRRPDSMVSPKIRPIKRHTYVPLPSQRLPPPTNLTSQDIMDLPIIFADDNQVIDTNVPTDLSTTGPRNLQPQKLMSSTTPTNKFVIVSKPSSVSNFVITPSSVKRPMPLSMVKQTPNKYAKIILSKKGMEENIRLSTVRLPPDAIPKSIPQVEQIDLEQELKTTILQKPKTMIMKTMSVLPKNTTMEAFEKMEQAAVQEDDDPDYIPPKNLKI